VTHEKSAGGTKGMHNGIGIMSDEADVSTDKLKKENVRTSVVRNVGTASLTTLAYRI
jgi:hypothetical protein